MLVSRMRRIRTVWRAPGSVLRGRPYGLVNHLLEFVRGNVGESLVRCFRPARSPGNNGSPDNERLPAVFYSPLSLSPRIGPKRVATPD